MKLCSLYKCSVSIFGSSIAKPIIKINSTYPHDNSKNEIKN